MTIEGHIYDVVSRRVIDGRLTVKRGRIASVEPLARVAADAPCVLPPLVDAHVHIESSMLLPEEFARLALRHGTLAAVADPHEIANVLGEVGVDFMIEHSRKLPFQFCFAVPSCVPCSPFETAGDRLDSEAVARLMARDEVYALAEVMNSVGVIEGDPEVLAKIAAARAAAKPIDGHAPTLSGEGLRLYAQAGITTDHECTTVAEAEEKLALGIKILLRRGSAADDFETLYPLLHNHSQDIMLCSDDKHPDSLLHGHINLMVRDALKKGCPLWNVLWAASGEPIRHYSIPLGLLQEGDSADFIVVDDLNDFTVRQVFRKGKEVSHPRIRRPFFKPSINNFRHTTFLTKDDLAIPAEKGKKVRVIVAEEGKILTGEAIEDIPTPLFDGVSIFDDPIDDGFAHADPADDILKIAVVNRYDDSAPVQVGFIRGFGLKQGALASTVAHDSHNLIVVGCDDDSMVSAANQLIMRRGGIAVNNGKGFGSTLCLSLPVAGLMSNLSGEEVAEQYSSLNSIAHDIGSRFAAPFMTLAFMALPVIPKLKITDKGLFDAETFSFTSLFVE